MNYSGATGTLGLAFAATGAAFPFFSPFLGWLGVFLTGSDTSSNALFGSLQAITAERLGFSRVLMAASNSSGGVLGKMIGLQSIAVAAAATGITVPQQSQLLRFTLKHSIILTMLVGLEVLVLPTGFSTDLTGLWWWIISKFEQQANGGDPKGIKLIAVAPGPTIQSSRNVEFEMPVSGRATHPRPVGTCLPFHCFSQLPPVVAGNAQILDLSDYRERDQRDRDRGDRQARKTLRKSDRVLSRILKQTAISRCVLLQPRRSRLLAAGFPRDKLSFVGYVNRNPICIGGLCSIATSLF